MASTAPPSVVMFYLDEHVSPAVAAYLRRYAIDVLTAQEAGRAGLAISDADQLTFATGTNRALVTRDRDFLNPRIVPQLATGQHAGIAHLLRSTSVGEQGRYLRFVAETETPANLIGRLLFLQPIPTGTFPDD